MILRKSSANAHRLENCHGGVGSLSCSDLLADFKKKDTGFKLIHDNVIDSGASIGEHRHEGDEEIYVILSGRGIMKIDGEDCPVEAGDVCLTCSGHSHSLVNSHEGPMHFLVIGTRL